jgi:hypothetical protein
MKLFSSKLFSPKLFGSKLFGEDGDTTTTVTLGGGTIRNTVTHAVYVRQEWSFEWTLAPYIHCDEATWCVAPTMPTATLVCEYGEIARPGALQFSKESRRDYQRFYVKVVFAIGDGETLDGTKTWYGIVELTDDQKGGAKVYTNAAGETLVVATGEQTWQAFGLEQLLAVHTIRNSVVKDAVHTTTVTVKRGVCFNEDGKANRHTTLYDTVYPFASKSSNAETWSSRHIVEYLLKHQTPTKANGDVEVPFALMEFWAPAIPDWDAPELDQEQQTTYDLLVSLVSRQRLASWYLWVDETTTPATVYVIPFTLSADSVSLELEGSSAIPANPWPVHLKFDSDHSARASLRVSALEQYDQFIVRGARRRSVFSARFSYDTIEAGWTAAQETSYGYGASNATGFPSGAEVHERQRWHAEARSRPEVIDVFRRFEIPDDWDGRDGTDDNDGDGNQVFPYWDTGYDYPENDESVIDTDEPPYYSRGLIVESTLPLLEGVDYSGSKIEDGSVDTSDSSGQERGPFVAWKLPNTSPTRYQDIQRIGSKSDLEVESPDENELWSCDVVVPPNDRAIELVVHGQPQWIIATDSFSPQPEDEVTGEHDYQDMIVTWSVLDDRYAEGVYPDDDTLALLEISLRRKVIYAGDSFRMDYVVPGTVVAIDVDGDLVTSDGGFVNDDRAQLQAVARVAWEWYGIDRYVLQLETDQLSSQVEIGELVTDIGDDTVAGDGHNHVDINTVITSIQFRTMRHIGPGEPEPPRMAITTGWGELDPLQLSFGEQEEETEILHSPSDWVQGSRSPA